MKIINENCNNSKAGLSTLSITQMAYPTLTSKCRNHCADHSSIVRLSHIQPEKFMGMMLHES